MESSRFNDSKVAGGTTVEPIEITEEEVQVLLKVIRSRLAPFTATQARDAHFSRVENVVGGDIDPRVMFVARYRDGQRKVLEEAEEAVMEMLV